MANSLMSASGGLSNGKLALADAQTTDVKPEKKFYSQTKELKTGNMPTKAAETKSITPSASPQSYTFDTNGKYCTGNMVVNVAAANNFSGDSGNRETSGGQQEMRRDEGNRLAYANTYMKISATVTGRKVVVNGYAHFHVTNNGTSGIVGDGNYSGCWLNFEVPF